MARVIVREGGADRIVELVDPITVAGRALENRIVLQDRQSSRRHCQFERIEWGYKLIDLESRNGTRVNDRTVNQALLRPGDCVQIGQALLIFEDPNFKEPPPEVVARFGPPMPVMSAAAPTPLASPIPPPIPSVPPPPPPLAASPPLYAAPPPASLPTPAPAGVASAGTEPALRRRPGPPTAIDRGFRAAMVERVRERKIITCVGICAALFGVLIVILIVYSMASGESPALRAARENYEKAVSLRIKDPGQALRLIQSIPADQQPYFDRAQSLKRQIDKDTTLQRSAVSEAEQKEFKELYEFCEMNRNNAPTYEQMYARCAEYRRKYPKSPWLSRLDEYMKISQEGRQGAMKSELGSLEQQVAEHLQKNEYAAALRRVKAMIEKYKAEIEARDQVMKAYNDVVDRARSYWEAQDARAKDLKERGQKDEARRAYEEAIANLGEGKVDELKDFCTLAQAYLDALK